MQTLQRFVNFVFLYELQRIRQNKICQVFLATEGQFLFYSTLLACVHLQHEK